MKQLHAPNGLRIGGTLETLSGEAIVNGWTTNPDTGVLEPDYAGSTDVWWDEQKTVLAADGSMTVLDEDGNEWPMSQCTQKDDEENEPCND